MKKKEEKNWTVIVDAHYLCYRAFYSLPKDLNFGPQSTNIIFGFLGQVRKLAEIFKTNQFIFCFDSKRSYRKLLYPEYKTREADPEVERRLLASRSQWDELREEVLKRMGFGRIYYQQGYEADDMIATLCLRLPNDYMIVSADEDLYQLLSIKGRREISMYNHKRVFTENDFTMGYGIEPPQWQIIKAIAGCITDTVEGVSGAGEVKAIQYVRGTLPEGKIKTRIKEEWHTTVARNLKLVGLPFQDGPVEINMSPFDPGLAYHEDEFETIAFMEVFRDYGFGSWLTGEGLEKWKVAFNTQGVK